MPMLAILATPAVLVGHAKLAANLRGMSAA